MKWHEDGIDRRHAGLGRTWLLLGASMGDRGGAAEIEGASRYFFLFFFGWLTLTVSVCLLTTA
jgi:hypothetical protein